MRTHTHMHACMRSRTCLPQRKHLPLHVLRTPALLGAARVRHDAIGALFIAAVDHVDPGGEAAVASRRGDVLLNVRLLGGAHLWVAGGQGCVGRFRASGLAAALTRACCCPRQRHSTTPGDPRDPVPGPPPQQHLLMSPRCTCDPDACTRSRSSSILLANWGPADRMATMGVGAALSSGTLRPSVCARAPR